MPKSLFAGAIALALSSPATPQAFGTTTAFVENAYIEKLSCDGGSGTGFKLSTGQWVSVHHVTKLGNCKLDGLPIIVTHSDEVGDFSTFIVPGDNRQGGIKPDCSGFRDRQWYFGTGHAGGLPILTSVPVLFANVLNEIDHPRGWKILAYNRYIPGQSGGPALNERGEAVGTVNAFAIFFLASFSRQLKDTILCQNPASARP
jgi:hypothetical protein